MSLVYNRTSGTMPTTRAFPTVDLNVVFPRLAAFLQRVCTTMHLHVAARWEGQEWGSSEPRQLDLTFSRDPGRVVVAFIPLRIPATAQAHDCDWAGVETAALALLGTALAELTGYREPVPLGSGLPLTGEIRSLDDDPALWVED